MAQRSRESRLRRKLISAPIDERVTIPPIIRASTLIQAIATSFAAGAEPFRGATGEASRRALRQDDVVTVGGLSQLWRVAVRRAFGGAYWRHSARDSTKIGDCTFFRSPGVLWPKSA